MRRLSSADRSRILRMLCDGMSMRTVAGLTGTSLNTVSKLLIDAGKACMIYHDQAMRQVQPKRLQINEIWTCSRPHVAGDRTVPQQGVGDIWTWIALDPDTRLIISYFVGDRDATAAWKLVHDLRRRFSDHVQPMWNFPTKPSVPKITSNQELTYARLVEIYGEQPPSDGQRSSNLTPLEPDKWKFDRQARLIDTHLQFSASVSPGFSKRLENQAYIVALHVTFLNFVRLDAQRLTPAMKTGVSDRPWQLKDVVSLIEQVEARRDAQAKAQKIAAEGEPVPGN